MKLVLSGTIESIGTRNDGTVKFTLGCQEMDASMAGNLFQMRNKFVKALLSDTNISEMEENIINEQNLQDGRKIKSPSQRLRAVLFKVHDSERITIPFDDWYRSEMERIIEHYKNKIND